MTGIVDGTYVKPNIQYYVNEKNNAVAPKITGAGATALDRQINSAFVSTVAKVALREGVRGRYQYCGQG